jgi:hypothetical protein
MISFTYLEKDKSIKIGVSPLVNLISTNPYSYKSTWPHMLVCELKHHGYKNAEVVYSSRQPWSNYDVIIIDHGIDFHGTWNFYSSLTDELYEEIVRLLSKVKIYSMWITMPDVKQFIDEKASYSKSKFATLIDKADEISKVCSKVITLDCIHNTGKQMIGDSHVISLWQPGWSISRLGYVTLKQTLESGLSSYLLPSTTQVTVCLGNLDIRHHIMRERDPLHEIDTLLSTLEKQLLDLDLDHVTIRYAMPIELEKRKIPPKLIYKGLKYFGSLRERMALVKYFNYRVEEICYNNFWNVYRDPLKLAGLDGVLRHKAMERPEGINISRNYHRWDYILNQSNPKADSE